MHSLVIFIHFHGNVKRVVSCMFGCVMFVLFQHSFPCTYFSRKEKVQCYKRVGKGELSRSVMER